MKKLGIAVVGCGGISQNHGASINADDKAELLYCVDTKPERAKAFSEQFGCKVLDDYTQLFNLPEVDVVHLCTPHFTHAKLAVDLLNHGKHIFTEKPMSIKVEDAEAMIAAAKANGKLLGVCFQNRLNDSTILAKDIIDTKKYGDILGAKATVTWDRHGAYYTESDWRGFYETEGGGSIINQAIHTIDMVDYLCGGITDVAAVATKLRVTDDYEVDDSCMANFTLASGKTAVYFSSNCYACSKPAEVEIVLEKATLVADQTMLRIEPNDGEVQVVKNAVAHGAKAEWGLSHAKMIDKFYESILTDKPFFCDGGSGIQSIKIINAIQDSKGKTIHLG